MKPSMKTPRMSQVIRDGPPHRNCDAGKMTGELPGRAAPRLSSPT